MIVKIIVLKLMISLMRQRERGQLGASASDTSGVCFTVRKQPNVGCFGKMVQNCEWDRGNFGYVESSVK